MPSPLFLRTGPFVLRVETSCPEVFESVRQLYDPRCILADAEFCDFHVTIDRPFLRRWIWPEAVFRSDGYAPFLPGPRRHAAPMLEWGMNWVISTSAHQFLIVHAAALERNGLALILPGPPGSGKSTLCAGLAFRGWRLLTDELTLVRPERGDIVPLARPISLKNQSIDVIRRFAPEATIGKRTEGSTKGTIALVKPPREAIDRIDEPASPRWVVFPKYEAGAATRLTPRSKAASFIELGESAMNYNMLGETGFTAMADLIDRSEVCDFVYSDLEEAIALFTGMADAAHEAARSGSVEAAGR